MVAASKTKAVQRKPAKNRPKVSVGSITPFLWYDKEAIDAAKFYVSIFKGSKMLSTNPMGCEFEIAGQRVMALNGGPHYTLNEAFSMSVSVKTQAQVDELWTRLTNGGEESRCGWLKDKYGLSWQIIPEALPRLMGDEDPAKAGRVVQAMLKMKKLDIATLERAHKGK